jgi:hypothetical protein
VIDIVKPLSIPREAVNEKAGNIQLVFIHHGVFPCPAVCKIRVRGQIEALPEIGVHTSATDVRRRDRGCACVIKVHGQSYPSNIVTVFYETALEYLYPPPKLFYREPDHSPA